MRRLVRVGGLALLVLFVTQNLAVAAEHGAAEHGAAEHGAAEHGAEKHGAEKHGNGPKLGEQLPTWSVAPFTAMLLCIALFPLAAPHWWEHNRNKGIVAALISVPLAMYLLAVFGQDAAHELEHKGKEYFSFIVLLGSLFIITGGIYIRGSLSGTPLVNTSLMAVGGMLASVIGTTGASVLLIRPLLRANAPRNHRAHIVVFFIFIVSNCGGLLTPLGDPPLFLGFLKGVPFGWTLKLWPQWLAVNGALLLIFNVFDQIMLDRDEREQAGSQLEQVMQHEPLGVRGAHNFLFLAGIVLTIFASGQGIGAGGNPWRYGVQEGLMIVLAVLGYLTTSKTNRANNRFTFAPIIEVAVLFAGIFVTMTPALALLDVHGPTLAGLGMEAPSHFFWASGILSSFLDNAPTYLTFAVTACSVHGVTTEGVDRYLADFLATAPGADELLAALSCGAVFMGANTYIGNGPNFMVKAIAEENGVRMPGFFGYMLYSGCVLIPLFIVISFIFFR